MNGKPDFFKHILLNIFIMRVFSLTVLTLTLMTGISDLHEEEGSWDSGFTLTLWEKMEFIILSFPQKN